VILPTVSTVWRGCGAAFFYGAEVAPFWTGGVGALVLRLAVVEGADRADWVIVLADGSSVPIPLTVAAVSGFVGRVSGLDFPFTGEKKDVGAHPLTILRAHCDNNREGQFQRAGFRVRIEKAGQGNLNTLGIKYGGFELHEETFIVLREIAEGEAMDGKLVLIGGRPEREPWSGADREGVVEASHKGTKEGSGIRGRHGGGDPHKCDHSVRVDFGRE